MSTSPKSSRPRAGASRLLLGSTFRYRSKAEWLRRQYSPDHPTFPLDPEIKKAIPADLPGEIPTNETELYADVVVPKRKAKRPDPNQPYDRSTDE